MIGLINVRYIRKIDGREVEPGAGKVEKTGSKRSGDEILRHGGIGGDGETSRCSVEALDGLMSR